MSTKSRGDQAEPVAQSGDWEAVQNNLLAYDQNVITSIANDIDTLLTFAGLFSAALTAFLLPTIALLHADNSETTVQLLSILVLRDDPPTDTLPFLDSSAASLPRSATFQPSASSVAVNSLWFLSLILSLASALFGILGKQWCREYMNWYSVLAKAQDNILLRQMRHEAWEHWHVVSLISIIPFLLELALIFFFVGLVVYSWTLHVTIFGFVISAVILVLLSTVALTVLPSLHRRCPYKSPTGWVYTRGAVLIGKLLHSRGKRHILSTLRSSRPRSHTKFPSAPEEMHDWRSWEMRQALDANLCELPGLLQHNMVYSQSEADATTDAFRIIVLVRALSAALRGCSDAALRQSIENCIRTIHDTMRTPPDLKLHQDVTVYAVRQVMGWTISPGSVDDCVQAQLATDAGVVDLNKDREVSRFRVRPHNRWRAQAGPYLTDGVLAPSSTNSMVVSTARKAFASSLSLYVDRWVESLGRPRPSDRAQWASRIIYVLATLRYVPKDYLAVAIDDGDTDITMLATVLTTVYRRLAEHTAAYCDGLIPMIFELLRLIGDINASDELTTCRVTPWRSVTWICERNCNIDMMEADLRRLYVLPQSGRDGLSLERCHLFVAAAANALDTVGYAAVQWQANDVVPPVFASSAPEGPHARTSSDDRTLQSSAGRIIQMLTSFVTACTKLNLQNCGAYIELPWLACLVAVYRRAHSQSVAIRDVHFTANPDMQREFLRFLASLRDNGRAGLLDGTALWHDFADLLSLLDMDGIDRSVREQIGTIRADVLSLELHSWEAKIAGALDIDRYTANVLQHAEERHRAASLRGALLSQGGSRDSHAPRIELLQRLSGICRYRYHIPPKDFDAFCATCLQLWGQKEQITVPKFAEFLQRMVEIMRGSPPIDQDAQLRPQDTITRRTSVDSLAPGDSDGLDITERDHSFSADSERRALLAPSEHDPDGETFATSPPDPSTAEVTRSPSLPRFKDSASSRADIG